MCFSHYKRSGLPVNQTGSITELNEVLNVQHVGLTPVSQIVFKVIF